jgi:two-component system, NtrC family, nitrogen regulation sensor histidine kinase NtrY
MASASRGAARALTGFNVRLLARLLALVASLTGLGYLLVATSLRAVPVVVGVLVVAQGAGLVALVHRSNRELMRFLEALRYDDFAHTHALAGLGGSFHDLHHAFERVLQRFRDSRRDSEAQLRHLEALLEHVPVAIVAVREDRVELLNGAARRLLDASAPLGLSDLLRYGAPFQRDVLHSSPGQRYLTRTEIDGVHRHLVLSATQLAIQGARLRLLTLQDIQRELDGNELAAWQDMARVLTHEIMSALTPIASLARTADELVDELRRAPRPDGADGPGGSLLDGDRLADLQAAVQTVARRSDSLTRFVHSYRALTQLPPPALESVALASYFERVARVFATEWAGRGVRLHAPPPPPGLTLVADEALLDQALFNLLRNAADAALSCADPQVWLVARLSDRGRPVLEVSDNGRGVDAALGEKIFLPFFSTKAHGSGIGLALARQIMQVHQGAITAAARPGGGAVFRLTF